MFLDTTIKIYNKKHKELEEAEKLLNEVVSDLIEGMEDTPENREKIKELIDRLPATYANVQKLHYILLEWDEGCKNVKVN